MANNEWLSSRGDDDQKGPVSEKELHRLAESGELRADDLVWKEGMDEWVPANRLKGITFSAPSPEPSASRPPKGFDKEALKSTFEDAQKKADEAAGVLWFLDLKFSRFVAPTLMRVIWVLLLCEFTVILISTPIAWLFKGDEYSLRMMVLSIFFSALLLVMARVSLEALMAIFRMAEHLREMNEKLASK